jgi:hypothetical protein
MYQVNMFQIFIKSIHGKTIAIDVNDLNTIKELKEAIYIKTKIPCIYQILLHSGKNLLDTETIKFYNITESDTILMNLRIGKPVFVTQNNKNPLL